MSSSHTPKNVGANDAFERVWHAKTAYLVDATDEFLVELQHQLALWSEEISEELARRRIKRAEKEENRR